jgi:hypothetical protein
LNKLLKYCLVVALALGVNTFAHATPGGDGNDQGQDGNSQGQDPRTAPEIDAGLATAGLAFLGGTIAVVRARRSK